MKNIKYSIDRDSIHIGTIVKTGYIDKINDDDARRFNLTEGDLVPSGFSQIRPSVLFVPDEDKKMNDLLYNSPAYRILNISDGLKKEDANVVANPDELIVSYPYNIADLLAYLGYRKELTYGDVLKIRQVIFSPEFYSQFCELFGFRETYSSEVQFYRTDESCRYGELIKDPKEIEAKMREFDKRRALGERGFSGVNEAPLDSYYFDILEEHSDKKVTKNLWGSLSFTKVRDAFAPNKKEEPNVKKLSLTD